MFECKYCKKECSKRSHKNHELRCPLNEDRVYKNGMLGKKGKNQYIKAKELGIEKPSYDTSKWKRGGAAAWTPAQRSEHAIKHKFGGYREHSGRSKKCKVFDSFDKEVTLQSTYELRCSEILNSLGIKWIRPKALKYDNKNYFADFYLPEVGIYLDPKNSYKAMQDASKIAAVQEQNNVTVYILLETDLTLENLKRLCS